MRSTRPRRAMPTCRRWPPTWRRCAPPSSTTPTPSVRTRTATPMPWPRSRASWPATRSTWWSMPAAVTVRRSSMPTCRRYQNLVGRVDHIAHFGMLVTDFRHIKAGLLHRANGGYLLIDAMKLLTQPFAWAALKRALLGREIRIESMAEMFSMVSTVQLEPQPIPLDVKVVLFGERLICQLLQANDPEFDELFRVVADLDDDLPREAGTQRALAAGPGRTDARPGAAAAQRGGPGAAASTTARGAAATRRGWSASVRTPARRGRRGRPPGAQRLAHAAGGGRRGRRHRRAARACRPRRRARAPRDAARHPGHRHRGRARRPGQRPGGLRGRAARPSARRRASAPPRGWATARWWTSSARRAWPARCMPRAC